MSFRRTAISICIACVAVLLFTERAEASSYLLDEIVNTDEITTTDSDTDTADQNPPVTNTVSEVTDIAQPATESVTETVEPAAESVTNVSEPLTDALEPVSESMSEVVEPVTQTAEPVVEIVEPVVETVTEVVEPVVEPVVEVAEPVVDVVEPVIQPAVESVEPVAEVVEPVVDAAEPVVPVVVHESVVDEAPSVPVAPAPEIITPDLPAPDPAIQLPGISDTPVVTAPVATAPHPEPVAPGFEIAQPEPVDVVTSAVGLPDTITIPLAPLPVPAPVTEDAPAAADAPGVDALPVEMPILIPELPEIFTDLPATSPLNLADGMLTEGSDTPLKSSHATSAAPLLSGFAPTSASVGGESPAGPAALAVALVTLVLLTRRARDELALLIPTFRCQSIPVPPG